MKNIFLSISIIIISTSLYSQNPKQKIFRAGEIYFYGYDFSHFKLAEAKRLNDGAQVAGFIFPWVGFMDANLPHTSLAGKMGVNIIPRYEATTNANRTVVAENVVCIQEHFINQDTIVKAIGGYELQEESGIGMVAIIECFYKATETASVYYVFFDIANREILDSYRFTTHKPGGFGLTSFWGENLESNFKKYIRTYYLPMKKAN
jgi:hypothetical protein